MGKPGCDPVFPLLLSQMFLYNYVGQSGISISIGEELALPWGHREAGLGTWVGGSGKWRFSA